MVATLATMQRPDPSTSPGPSPRGLLALLAVIMAVQVLYAAIDVLGRASAPGSALYAVAVPGLIIYAIIVAAFGVGIWRMTPWAWGAGVAGAVAGLVLAGVRVAAGDAIGQHALGMLIDAGLLVYLVRPANRRLFTS